MKLTPAEEKVVRSTIAWYVGELSSITREGYRNAAFAAATARAVERINVVFNNRLTQALIPLIHAGDPEMVRDGNRVRKIILHANELATDEWKRRAKGWSEPHRNPGDDTLRTYLQTMEAMLDATRNRDAIRALDGRSIDEGERFCRVLWATLRNARVFDFTPADYAISHHAADVYTTTKIAGKPWVPEGESDMTPEESQEYIDKIHAAGEKVPFPDPLPFDANYIGFGFGVPLTGIQAEVRTAGAVKQNRAVASALLGYVIWGHGDSGTIAEIIQVVEPEDNYILPNVVCVNGTWVEPLRNLAPWITTHLIAVINHHRKLIVETKPSFAQRRDWQKRGKTLKVPGLIPKPYYVVRLEKKLVEDTGRRTRGHLAKIARELAYRHDRRGHERCYIRRGKLPLSAEDLEKLQKAEYRIWTHDEPDSDAYRQLMERGQPPKAPDEWIAILTRWIDPTVVGPEDKPYVPAIRMTTSGRVVGAAQPGASPDI